MIITLLFHYPCLSVTSFISLANLHKNHCITYLRAINTSIPPPSSPLPLPLHIPPPPPSPLEDAPLFRLCMRFFHFVLYDVFIVFIAHLCIITHLQQKLQGSCTKWSLFHQCNVTSIESILWDASLRASNKCWFHGRYWEDHWNFITVTKNLFLVTIGTKGDVVSVFGCHGDGRSDEDRWLWVYFAYYIFCLRQRRS